MRNFGIIYPTNLLTVGLSGDLLSRFTNVPSLGRFDKNADVVISQRNVVNGQMLMQKIYDNHSINEIINKKFFENQLKKQNRNNDQSDNTIFHPRS